MGEWDWWLEAPTAEELFTKLHKIQNHNIQFLFHSINDKKVSKISLNTSIRSFIDSFKIYRAITKITFKNLLLKKSQISF